MTTSATPMYVRVSADEDAAEYYDPGDGWIPNFAYYWEIVYNGNAEPVSATEALTAIRETAA